MARQVGSGILVVGGTGYFGSLLVEDLLHHTDSDICVAARKRQGLERLLRRVGLSPRLSFRECDLTDPSTVDALVPSAGAAVCAAGPFQGLPLTLLESCLRHGVPYVDLADDRGFYVKARDCIVRADQTRVPTVCIGWSAVPALSGLLARIATEGMDRVEDVFVQIAPGNRFPRNRATVASLLSSLGKPFPLFREGEWQDASGWTEPRTFQFPLPVGPQRGYLVDVPDHEIFPELFHAHRVEFRVGSELAVFNHSASVLARLAKRFAIRWDPWAGWLSNAMGVLGFLGHEWGAVGVETSGYIAGLLVRRQACVIAQRAGQTIPVLPAGAMAARLLSGKPVERGLVSVDRWLSRAELEAECGKRGFELTVRDLS